jgi:isopropylmalate/homocitrate/citramalate synthase
MSVKGEKMDRDIIVREVGLGDGLQIVDAFFPTEAKKAWITAASAAGIPEIQVTSFVPAKVIPQFTDALDVVAHALDQLLHGAPAKAKLPKGFKPAAAGDSKPDVR